MSPLPDRPADTFVTVGNTTDGPLVVDDAGHFIDAHGFGPANVARQPAKRLLDDGQLVKVEVAAGVDDAELSPEFRRARAATERRLAGDDAATVSAAMTAAELDDRHTNGDPDTLADQSTDPTIKAARTSSRTRRPSQEG